MWRLWDGDEGGAERWDVEIRGLVCVLLLEDEEEGSVLYALLIL